VTAPLLSLATWNVNSLKVRLAHLEQWLGAAGVDALGLQETKVADSDFPGEQVERLGLKCAWHGQRTYNGVALLARSAVVDVVRGIPGFVDDQARVIAGTIEGVRVINVYVPNGQSVGSDKYLYKLRWLDGLRNYLGDALARHERLAVIGDYNIAPEDRDVHDPKAWEGQVHVSPDERAALDRLRNLGLVDVFRQFPQAERTFSWWDYRAAAFRRNAGLRIDLILANPALASRCTACRIDRDPRRWERPSDHAPVVATFDLSAGHIAPAGG
jgi:exodeoxyribonuclease III